MKCGPMMTRTATTANKGSFVIRGQSICVAIAINRINWIATHGTATRLARRIRSIRTDRAGMISRLRMGLTIRHVAAFKRCPMILIDGFTRV